MKVRDVMTGQVLRIHPEEPVEVAARTLAQYHIGAVPVCGGDGRLCGVVTDRDLVVRCMASGRNSGSTKVRQVMTEVVVSVPPDADLAEAARIMGKYRVRRLPVVENGRLCGMVSLADLAGWQEADTDGVLRQITGNIHMD